MSDTVAKKSDLGVRTLSAIVMLAVAGTALWLGGWAWYLFVALVAGVCFFELARLVRKAFGRGVGPTLGVLAGAAYVSGLQLGRFRGLPDSRQADGRIE